MAEENPNVWAELCDTDYDGDIYIEREKVGILTEQIE